ncbi:membrane protein [Paenibacillus swuensis]|uniref:Membrane protein n=1 Tax=Paenibacillus swuensis TaxID=1178515 RepID=A0A172TE59_9BACL|nr:sporulation integral membrane protein YlbJ [Paenibacillus swuensis]ANE45083.1 membrane protein [Paenibacillus swuensis]
MRLPSIFSSILISTGALIILLLLVQHPAVGLSAALKGIAIWWDILFPALFPFFVMSELMIGFGVVHFMGTLFDPMMRPLFRVPGIGGFIMAMGFASGYPVGARLTAKLWEQKQITREEGERLVAFTTSSDPIFLIGAVSIGFFHDAGLAAILAATHYGSAILVGIVMRFHGRSSLPTPAKATVRGNILVRCFRAMHEAKTADGRPFGELLKDAVQSSLRLSFIVGGLVVFFATVIDLLSAAGFMPWLYGVTEALLASIGISASLAPSFVNGWFEVTLGAKFAAAAGSGVPLVYKAAAAAFVLSWAGLSVHAQIVSLIQHTGMRYGPFFFARLLHGILAFLLTLWLWEPLQQLRGTTGGVLQVFSPLYMPAGQRIAEGISYSVYIIVILFVILIAMSVLHHMIVTVARPFNKK